MAKGQQRSNKEVRKPNKAAALKKDVAGLAPRDPVKTTLGKADRSA